MKFYTHPYSFFTNIQAKDGSSFFKNWLYFKQNLRLESINKNWESKSKKINTFIDFDFNKKDYSTFWEKNK